MFYDVIVTSSTVPCKLNFENIKTAKFDAKLWDRNEYLDKKNVGPFEINVSAIGMFPHLLILMIFLSRNFILFTSHFNKKSRFLYTKFK